MKNRLFKSGLLIISGLMLSSCVVQDLSNAPAFMSNTIETFDDESNIFTASNGWTNGSPFACYWNADNVTYSNGEVALELNKDGDKLYGGELKSNDHFSYGYYSAKMKPSNVTGTCSAFFVYTGPSEDNPWDEIDIEFLGHDTTRVQFNYFSNGKGGHEHWYDLGFDASQEYHEYGFYWSEEEIIWYVDSEPVYKATNDIPTTPGRIIMNTWSGDSTAEAWMKKLPDDFTTSKAYYDEVNYTHLDGSKYEPVIVTPESSIDPTEFTWSDLPVDFTSADSYLITKEDDLINVTYSDIGGSSYKNMSTNLPNAAKYADAISFKVKNNGTKDVNLRVDVNATVNNAPKAVNLVATQDGKDIRTDLEWGGSFATIKPGKESEVIVKYDGDATSLMFMIDSSINDNSVNSGDVTFSQFKLGDLDLTDNPAEPDNPGDSDDTIDVTNLHWSAMNTSFTPSVDAYTLNEENGKLTVSYEDIAGNSYANINSNLPTNANLANAVKFKIKNNGTESVSLRTDVNAMNNGSAKALNLSATQDGTTIRTDLEWGGSFATLESGQESEIIVTFKGEANNLMFMIDSSVAYDDKTLRSGNVTFSSFEIGYKEDIKPEYPNEPENPGTTDPEEPDTEDPDTPTTPVTPTEGEWVDFEGTFSSNEVYQVTKDEENNSYNVTYTNIGGQTYQNIAFNLPDVDGYNRVKFTVKNNGENIVQARTDVNTSVAGGGTSEKTTSLNLSATQDGTAIRTDTEWGGSFYNIDAGQETTVEIVFSGDASILSFFFDSSTSDTELRSGNLTISNIQLAYIKENESEDTPATNPDETGEVAVNPNFYNPLPDNYILTTEDGVITVDYKDVYAQTYQCLSYSFTENVTGKTKFSFKIKNNKETVSNLKFDLIGENNAKLNASATFNGSELYTDFTNGGSSLTLEGNAEGTVEIVVSGDMKVLNIFIDTVYLEDKDTPRSGNISFSEFKAY